MPFDSIPIYSIESDAEVSSVPLSGLGVKSAPLDDVMISGLFSADAKVAGFSEMPYGS